MTADSPLTLKLPDGYAVADLKLRWFAPDEMGLDMDLFRSVCTPSGMDFDKVLQNPGPVASAARPAR